MKKQLHTTGLFSIFCFLFSMFSQAQEYDWQWAYRGGGTQQSGTGATWGGKLEQVFDVKIDQYNNYYFAGTVLNFNPSFMGEDITKYGTNTTDNDVYIVSLDCEGNFRWHTTIGGHVGAEYKVSMALDTLGGLYISFSTPNFARPNNSDVPPHYAPGVALGPVFSNIPHADARQIALIKYDTNGNYLWHHMPQDENVTAIQTEGYFYGGGGAYSIIAEPDGTLHWHCLFLEGNHLDGQLVVTEAMALYHVILKYDKDGNYLSHIPIPLGGSVNNNVKLYYESITQRYYVAVGVHAANSIPSWDGEELYGAVIALDNQGNELWSHKSPTIPGTNAVVVSLTIDSQSNIYLSGNAANQGDDATEFAGYTFTHHSVGPYLIKLDSDGNLLWGTNLNPATGGTAAALNACVGCNGRDLAINGDEIAMATGLHENYWGSLAMPRLYGHQQDPVLIRFDKETGVPFAMHDIEGPGGVRDELMTVAVDHNGNYVVGGYGRSTLFLNHDTIDPLYSMGGDSDFFVAKLAKNTVCSIDECYGVVVPAPTGETTQTLNAGQTLANLEVEGENLQWYADAELTEPLAETHIVENGVTYYVTQTIGSCIGEIALAVTVATLGVSDFEKLEIKLYPNPTSGILYIETSQELYSYEVYNLIGQRLLKGNVTQSINLKDLSKGTYIIRLTTQEGAVITEKVIKE